MQQRGFAVRPKASQRGESEVTRSSRSKYSNTEHRLVLQIRVYDDLDGVLLLMFVFFCVTYYFERCHEHKCNASLWMLVEALRQYELSYLKS